MAAIKSTVVKRSFIVMDWTLMSFPPLRE